MASPRSYAEALRDRTAPTGDYFPTVFPSNGNRRASAISNISPHRSNSIVTTPEVILESPTGTRSPPNSSSPNLTEQLRPANAPRRPSIAQVLSDQVLGRIASRGSYSSETPSRLSYPGESSGYDEPAPVKISKKKKKGKGRKKSAQARDHGDFIASRGKHVAKTESYVDYQTPLLTAITEGNIERVKEIIHGKSQFPGEDSPHNRPLQLAALHGQQEIVEILVATGELDVNARDTRERTAVFAAVSRGQDAIARILKANGGRSLSTEEARIANQEQKLWRAFEAQTGVHKGSPLRYSQTVEGADFTADPDSDYDALSIRIPTADGSHDGDHIYKLEVGSVENIKEMEEAVNQKRQVAQERGEWVKGPLKNAQIPLSEKEIPIRHARYPGFGFQIPIVEFDFSDNGGHRIISPTPTVDEVLYGSSSSINFASLGPSPTQSPCRWYHLPANHIGWAEDLIRRIYESRSPSEQNKRDVILRREPFTTGDQDHTNPTLLDPRPQARSLRPICRNMTLDRDGTQRLSTAFALHVPYIHWETEISRGEMHHVMEQVRQGRKDDIDDVSLNSIPNMGIIQNHPQWTKNEKLLCAYLYNSPPVHPRRTLDQFYYHMLEDTEQRDQDQVITRYYHNVWKRNHHFPEDDEEFDFAMPTNDVPEYKFSLNSPSNFEQPEIQSLGSPVSPKQLPGVPGEPISEPLSRPDAHRFSSHHGEIEAKDERHVIMVDQLWLWILDENTIITSFPQNWAHDDDGHHNDDDPMDVLKSIHRYLTLVNRPPLETVYDLAQLIVYKCLVTFCRKSTPYGAMQILDVYESAIASVTDKETKIFGEFAARSKKPKNGSDRQRLQVHSEEMYDISEEIEQLKEIKDIQDELHILSVLLDNQKSVLKQATQALKHQTEERASTPRSPPTLPYSSGKEPEYEPYSSANSFNKLYLMVVEQENRRRALEVQAEQANNALNHLLDLKQKQANVSEARSARWTAESTKQQGNIMVLFTLVTIIFAPLTLIVTMFSLHIEEFPDILHMSFVLKYMFAISVAIIIPLLGIVVYATRVTIKKLLWRWDARFISKTWYQQMRWKRRKRNVRRWWVGWQRDGRSADTVVEGHDEKRKRRWSWGLKGTKARGNGFGAGDTEKGVVFVETANGKHNDAG